MPLIPYQWTPTEDVGEASLTKFGMSADGDLELMAPSKRLELPYQYAEPKKDRPKLAVAILDRSPSMNCNSKRERTIRTMFLGAIRASGTTSYGGGSL